MKLRLLVSLLVMIALSLACSTGSAGTAPPPQPQPTAVVVTQVVVHEVTSTPQEVVEAPAATEEPIALPPTSVPTKNPATFVVSATLTKNADCRTGPGSSFDPLISFSKGDVLEVVGRNPDFNNTWWVVVIPGSYATCWLSFGSTLAKGNFDSLEIVTPVTPALVYTVQATLIHDAPCRTGPGTDYNVAAMLSEGMVVEIIGRNPDFYNTWWVVRPPESGITCWLSIASALAEGDFSDIPIVNPP